MSPVINTKRCYNCAEACSMRIAHSSRAEEGLGCRHPHTHIASAHGLTSGPHAMQLHGPRGHARSSSCASLDTTCRWRRRGRQHQCRDSAHLSSSRWRRRWLYKRGCCCPSCTRRRQCGRHIGPQSNCSELASCPLQNPSIWALCLRYTEG
jgi:hypothetical protein